MKLTAETRGDADAMLSAVATYLHEAMIQSGYFQTQPHEHEYHRRTRELYYAIQDYQREVSRGI